MRYEIEPTITPGDWMVTVDRGDVRDIVHFGSASDCIEWCVDQGAVRLGPRVFEAREA